VKVEGWWAAALRAAPARYQGGAGRLEGPEPVLIRLGELVSTQLPGIERTLSMRNSSRSAASCGWPISPHQTARACNNSCWAGSRGQRL